MFLFIVSGLDNMLHGIFKDSCRIFEDVQGFLRICQDLQVFWGHFLFQYRIYLGEKTAYTNL